MMSLVGDVLTDFWIYIYIDLRIYLRIALRYLYKIRINGTFRRPRSEDIWDLTSLKNNIFGPDFMAAEKCHGLNVPGKSRAPKPVTGMSQWISGWWARATPLKNDGLRQLGWLDSLFIWENKTCSKPPTRYVLSHGFPEDGWLNMIDSYGSYGACNWKLKQTIWTWDQNLLQQE